MKRRKEFFGGILVGLAISALVLLAWEFGGSVDRQDPELEASGASSGVIEAVETRDKNELVPGVMIITSNSNYETEHIEASMGQCSGINSNDKVFPGALVEVFVGDPDLDVGPVEGKSRRLDDQGVLLSTTALGQGIGNNSRCELPFVVDLPNDYDSFFFRVGGAGSKKIYFRTSEAISEDGLQLGQIFSYLSPRPPSG